MLLHAGTKLLHAGTKLLQDLIEGPIRPVAGTMQVAKNPPLGHSSDFYANQVVFLATRERAAEFPAQQCTLKLALSNFHCLI
jgi:hypothetical protein